MGFFKQWKSYIVQKVLPNSVADVIINMWHLEVTLIHSLKKSFFFLYDQFWVTPPYNPPEAH